MKRFRIYLPFAVNEIKRQMSYKGAFYLFILISTFGSFVAYFLWSAIYGSSSHAVLGGLSRSEMTVYIFMVYVTSSIVNISISDWVSEDVVKGTVAMQLIKPMDYRLSLISRATGVMAYQFVLPSVFIWIGLEVYKYFVLGLGFTALANIGLYLLSSVMSFLIFVLFDFCVGMIAFFTNYIFGMILALMINKKGIRIGSLILCVSIILSTMLIKQHSVFDVITAFIMAFIMYLIVYYYDVLVALRRRRAESKSNPQID